MNLEHNMMQSDIFNNISTTFKINNSEFNKCNLYDFINIIPDEVIIFDKDSNFSMLNKAIVNNPAYDFSATNTEELLKQLMFYDLNGKPIPFESLPSQRVLRGEGFTDYRLVLKTNTGIILYKEFSGTPIFDCYGNLVGGFAIAHDIKEKVKSEESSYIEAQYNSLKQIIENLDLGFARYTYPEFNFIGINHKGYEQLSELFPDIVSINELKKMNLHDLFNERVQLIKDEINESLRNSKTSCFRIGKYQTHNGTEYIKWIYQPLLNLKGEVFEVIIIGVNITKEIKEKHKMEEVLRIQDEIYANVSHELKTPLNVIFSANQMMDIYLNHNSINEYRGKLNEYNHSIKQNCYRLIKLINNIVDLSKSHSGLLDINLRNVNIVNIVESIVNSVSIYVESKGLEIIFESNVKEKIIACDVNMIERVMLNLISNAVKFSKEKGKIIVNVLDKGDIVEISVKDSGTGIKKKHLDLIFQRFYQADKSLSRNSEGSGIGLSLVKSMIDIHKGGIRVESVVGKGSKFIVELPANVIKETNDTIELNSMNNKVEMLKVEFSDIYAVD